MSSEFLKFGESFYLELKTVRSIDKLCPFITKDTNVLNCLDGAVIKIVIHLWKLSKELDPGFSVEQCKKITLCGIKLQSYLEACYKI